MSVTDAQATTERELDQAVDELKVGAERWAQLPVADRAALFRRVHAAVVEVAHEWATTAARAVRISATFARTSGCTTAAGSRVSW